MKIVNSLSDAQPRQSGTRVILPRAGEVIWSLCCGDKEVADLSFPPCLSQLLCHQIANSSGMPRAKEEVTVKLDF